MTTFSVRKHWTCQVCEFFFSPRAENQEWVAWRYFPPWVQEPLLLPHARRKQRWHIVDIYIGQQETPAMQQSLEWSSYLWDLQWFYERLRVAFYSVLVHKAFKYLICLKHICIFFVINEKNESTIAKSKLFPVCRIIVLVFFFFFSFWFVVVVFNKEFKSHCILKIDWIIFRKRQ